MTSESATIRPLSSLRVSSKTFAQLAARANGLSFRLLRKLKASVRKTIVVEAIKRTADKALEATGGSGYFRASGLERILRDAQAAQFHPMQAKKQHHFTGRLAMDLNPVVS